VDREGGNICSGAGVVGSEKIFFDGVSAVIGSWIFTGVVGVGTMSVTGGVLVVKTPTELQALCVPEAVALTFQ
jgi:hypothetical protein